MMNFSRKDPAQESAIRHGAGPCAVIAGPGSGKTYVLVEHILYLIREAGVPPSSILVLTFSRAAAGEMQQRFLARCRDALCAPGMEVTFGTFHSVFYRILSESSGKRLALLPPSDKYRYLRHLCDNFPFSSGAGRGLSDPGVDPEELQLLISRFKNGLPCRQRWVPALVREYDLYLRSRRCLDFDDMILSCLDLFQKEPDVLERWRRRFSWILVDEFQDVSRSQYDLLTLLGAPADNIFIVGDDDQSIYGFRGADPATVQRFLKDYCAGRNTQNSRSALQTAGEDGKVHFLATNYRCGRSILHAGARVIRENIQRIEKEFHPGSALEGSFFLRPFTGREEEYGFIAEELRKMGGEEQEHTAVIFRTHAGAGAFLDVLEKNSLPYTAEGRSSRIRQKPDGKTKILRDLTAYYRCAARLFSEIPGEGASRRDLLQIMNRPDRYLSGSFITREKNTRRDLLEASGYDRQTVGILLQDLELLASLAPAYSMRYLLHSMGYLEYAVSTWPEAADFLMELSQRTQNCRTGPEWLRLLRDCLRETEEEEYNSAPPAGPARGIRVMTMHACKGLEFDTVFIPDLNEGNIPSRRAAALHEIEEERRLLYVAMTRAKKMLTITYLEGTPERPAAPSRFLRPLTGSAGSRGCK